MKDEKFPVLILGRFHPDARAWLQGQNFQILEESQGGLARALIIRSGTKVHREFLQRHPKLQVLVSCTAGFDHIDLSATQEFGICVMHTPRAHTESAAELTWALILAGQRRLARADSLLRRGSWERESLEGQVLYRKTLGLIGLGRIGSRVAEIAEAFRMRVLAFDPYQEDKVFHRLGAQRSSWEEVLKSSDILSFHVPLTSETRHMLKRSSLEFLNREAFVVNTSRGPVICETDLVEALQKEWIKGCGLDVFEREPLPKDSPLLKFPQVVITPHLGAMTDFAFREASFEGARKIQQFLVRGETSDVLPPQTEWFLHIGHFRAALS